MHARGSSAHWNREQPEELQEILLEITHDERIMAAAACAPDLTLLTKTPEFPDAFTCEGIGQKVRGGRFERCVLDGVA